MTFYSPMPRVWPIVAALLFALTACESSDTTQDDTIPTSACASVECADDQTCDEATGECISTAEPECVSDSDCNDSTLACIEGVCVSKCEGVTCPDGQVCDPTSGGCLQDYSCSSDGDCPDGMTCGESGVCGLPRAGDCTGGVPCADGLTCVNGPVSLCVAPCDTVTDCEGFEYCMDSTNVPIAPMAGYMGYCFPNTCEPEFDGIGIAQVTDYFAPCSDRAGDDDAGICLPAELTGVISLCIAANGPKQIGEACDPLASWGSEDLCGPGSLCLEPVFGGTCAAVCDVLDDSTCEQTEYFNGMNDNACAPFSGSAGFCVPSIGAAGPGESCDPESLTAACEDNYGCGPGNLERTEYSCNAWCDPETSGVSATFCGEEEYCWTSSSSATIGVCAPSACTSEVQCSEGEVCDNDTGECVDILSAGGCIETADCDAGQVCEANTCVLGRLGDCSGDVPCSAGLECINAGVLAMCVAPCSANTDCNTIEYCATGDNISMNSTINSFFGVFEGHCMPNLCSPTVTSSDQNIAYNAEYMGPCSDRNGDDTAGICVGPQDVGGNNQGLCIAANGPQGEGDACNPGTQWGSNDLCGNGTICPIGVDNPTCLATCDALGSTECSENQACGPFFDRYGFCLEATGAPGSGETCDPTLTTAFPCADGYGCAPLDADLTTYACQAFCDPAADGATATFCAESEICIVYDVDSPGIGICLPQG